ncbi:hypothetical protein AGOR_G00080130 [Albula goreensis]|uniref:Caspase 9 n=1 Tax=Albula goreensis TaxID=1534307 RepID=A0A8T3DJJ4_9TELE|nr:hypothetical protein AGOR_G00080130 [Albula goreensis]
MDATHRQILQRNRSNLVRELDPSSLYDGLLSRGIFTQDMIDEIQSAGTRRDQARQLVRDLETRGSRAFAAFLEGLQETGQDHMARLLLDGDSPRPPVPILERPTLLPVPLNIPKDTNKQDKPDKFDITPQRDVTAYPKKLDALPSPFPEKDKLSPRPVERIRRDSIQNYKMDASPCGHCLIINNVDFEPQCELKNRKGSDIDCDRLEKRFKSLNFIVDVKKNLKQRQIKHALSALSKMDHSKYDCCVVIILSHGTEATHSRFPVPCTGWTGPRFRPAEEVKKTQGLKSPLMSSNPPQGVDDETDALPVSSSSDSLSLSDEPDARATLPTPSDILVSYSTFPGYVSWRDTQTGSWYVETLDRIMEENVTTSDLVTILMMVNNEVSQISAKGLYKQMPGSFNFLRKLLYFQPPHGQGQTPPQ